MTIIILNIDLILLNKITVNQPFIFKPFNSYRIMQYYTHVFVEVYIEQLFKSSFQLQPYFRFGHQSPQKL